MSSKSLSKVHKQIAKKKGGKSTNALHERSRDAHRLQRASDRDARISKVSSIREKLNQPFLERMAYFHASLQFNESPAFELSEVQKLIETYIHRSDTELAEIKESRRPGRPPSTREGHLKHRIDLEEKEYRSGFWLPDLEEAENVTMLKEWSGEWGGLGTLKFVRIAQNGGKKESSFPPKGMS